ncbi:MAG: DUF2130 domain-containing protein [Bacteroidetes bacterium]|nr:DUF2130 domain-containing protein [Bacteroidota bacterium]MBS1757117.1 DUF2130 domain-containing protein [Bacteroidota bacterium]
MATDIKCPNCGHQFEPNEAIRDEVQKELRLKMQDWQRKKDDEFLAKLDEERKKLKENLEENIRKSVSADFENQVKLLQSNNADNEEKLKQARQKELDFLKKMQELKNKEEELELEIQIKLQQERLQITDQVRKQEAEKNSVKENEYNLRQKELEKQLEDQKKLVDEMKRKAEQGSMQLQGEIQEIALEELLRTAFPFDMISEVGKGVRGADCIQTVRNNIGVECGKIIYESKRTENFTADWIDKLKNDMLGQGADIAVIVTKTMPKDMQQFGEKSGVYICSFSEVKSLAVVLRNAILKISDSKKSQENKGEKMVALYNYLTGHEFIGNWNAIREGFRNLRAMMQKEREDFEKNWKKKEKQIELIIQNSLHISGSVEGIAGRDSINMQLEDDINTGLIEN